MNKSQKFFRASTINLLLIFAVVFPTISGAMATTSLTNLPPAAVTLKCFNGTSAYFVTQLSNVPSGFGVANGNYSGWCIDRSTLMARAPSTHQVLLYSSINPPAGSLSNRSWNMVNYVINHKQGNATEIQDVIWSFVNLNGTYTPPTSTAISAMIKDAQTNGKNFIPTGQQTATVIANPISALSTDAPVQISIIEVVAAKLSATTTSPTSTPLTSAPNSSTTYLYLVAAAIVALIIIILAIVIARSRMSKTKG